MIWRPADQSAAIPYRIGAKGAVEVLLVTSKLRRRWLLPKGRVPPNMRAPYSAAREALEEGGVVGTASSTPVAVYEQEKVTRDGSLSTIRIRAFPVRISTELQVWAEMRVRQRRWMTVKKAISKVDDPRIRRVLKTFRDQRRCSTD